MQQVLFRDLGKMDYQVAWDYQENLLKENVVIKSALRSAGAAVMGSNDTPAAENESPVTAEAAVLEQIPVTRHHLLLVEHPPVYTLGKSGHEENILIKGEEMERQGISYYKTNRGGDITFHGPGQLVGYPILDLEKFYTDIGKYLRALEETIIRTIGDYGLKGERSPGETGVWLDAAVHGRERKICAMGVRCSRWVTMHGFALNVNTDLGYFGNIIPCGIPGKQVTSLEKELGSPVPMEQVKARFKINFEKVFGVELVDG